MSTPAEAARSPVELAFSLAVVALALGHGVVALSIWAGSGTVPGARDLLDVWPLAFGGILVALALAGFSWRAGATELALAALAWAIGVEACRDLPTFPAARNAGDGLALVPWHVVIALGGGLYALRPWRGHGAASRACALLVLWTTGNFKMFTRDRDAVYGLFAAAVLLVWLVHGRRLGARALFAGPARLGVWISAAFVVWWAAAAAGADSPRLGVALVLRLATGALLAWTIAGAVDRDGVSRCVGALLVGLVLALGMLASAVLEMHSHVDWDRILAWRLRLFGLHANQIGPFFAWGSCLLAPLVLVRPRRPGLAPLLVLCLAALAWTASRASWGGLALGLPIALLAANGRLPRQPLRWTLAAGAAVALGIALLVSPVGEPLRARLDERAQQPSALGQRWHFWKMAGEAIRDHPVLGLGPNHYYAHAQYAEPSYYDGTVQVLHPHNVVLAAGESAGIPGALLFVALCLAVLEALRRTCLAAEDAARRRRIAGLLGALVALLASNLLDLGQSQNTLVSMLAWIALGLAGAEAGLASGAKPLSLRVSGLLASLALVPMAILPLTGRALLDRARAARFEGESRRACELSALTLRVHPWNEGAFRALIGSYRELGRGEELLAVLRASAEASPSRAAGWFELARELLEQGQAREAIPALERAAELDPRGPRQGDVSLSMAWAWLLLGDADAARMHLLESLRKTSGAWRRLPSRSVQPRPGDPVGARPIGFEVAGGDVIRFDDLLEELSLEALLLTRSDFKHGRRLLIRVVELFGELSFPERALALLEEYVTLQPDAIGSVQFIRLELLGDLGRWDELTDSYEGTPYKVDPHVTTAYLRALLDGVQVARIDLQRDWPLDLDAGKPKDIFFTAGENAGLFDVVARLALLRGDEEAAFRALRAGLYDEHTVGPRTLRAQAFLRRVTNSALGDAALSRALGVLLHEASLGIGTSRDLKRHREWARIIAASWSGSREELALAAEDAASGTGVAGEVFLMALDRVLSGR